MSDKNKNFYEILNLKRDCTPDEIRKSFIELSKQYHPDKNMNMEYSHKKFLDISEAYNTLNNPLKRKQYDEHFSFKSHIINDSSTSYGYSKNYGFNSSSQTSSYSNNGNRLLLRLAILPKAVLFATLAFITIFGVGIQFHFIRTNFESKKAMLENRSLMSSLIANNAREQAKRYGREEQMRRLQQGVLGQIDPTEILDKYIRETNLDSKYK